MKATISYTFATKQFENVKPQVEFEVPDMDPLETYFYFQKMFQGEIDVAEIKKPFKKFDDMDDDEFQEEADKLLKRKPHLKSWVNRMYDMRGLDRDHINGYDDGEQPEEREYQVKEGSTREKFTLEEAKEPF